MGTAARCNWRMIGVVFVVFLVSGCGVVGNSAGATGGSPEEIEAAAAAHEQCLNEPDPAAPASVTIWVSEGSTPETVEGIDRFLESWATVEKYEYVDADQTYQRFKDFYSDDPEIVDVVEPEQLPTSFEVEMTSIESARAAELDLQILGGVDSVEIAPQAAICSDQLATLTQACELGARPEKVKVWLENTFEDGPAPTAVSAVLGDSPLVESFQYKGFDETLRELEADVAMQDAIKKQAGVSGLPTSFDVTVVAGENDGRLEELRSQLEALDAVSQVSILEVTGSGLCPLP